MFDLALHGGETPVPLSAIAERQKISVHYLEQLMTLLKRADLVKSSRGAQGGYLLTRPLDQITVGEILSALVGSLAPTDCVSEDAQESELYCVTRVVYAKMYQGIKEVVDSLTLADMKRDFEQNTLIFDICECK